MSLTPEQAEKVNAAALEAVRALMFAHPEYILLPVDTLVAVFTAGMVAGLDATVSVIEAAS